VSAAVVAGNRPLLPSSRPLMCSGEAACRPRVEGMVLVVEKEPSCLAPLSAVPGS
jgi:hypothetical protein